MLDPATTGRLRIALAALEPGQRQEILAALDELTRPMTTREIERALRAAGHSRSWSAGVAGALKELDLLTITDEQARG